MRPIVGSNCTLRLTERLTWHADLTVATLEEMRPDREVWRAKLARALGNTSKASQVTLFDQPAKIVASHTKDDARLNPIGADDTYLDLDTLDVEPQALFRKEQQKVRMLILGDGTTGKCSICDREFPADLLVAAHIKSRYRCTDSEKRDVSNNVILMCKFGCDDLFERGYITVLDGRIVAGPLQAATFGDLL